MKVSEAVEHLLDRIETYGDDDVLIIMWTPEDIQVQVDLEHLDLSREQLVEVLNYLERNHNADRGINWDVVGEAIHKIKQGGDDDPSIS